MTEPEHQIPDNAATTTSARSFFDLSEATATVLDLLSAQLPDCAVFVAYHDQEAQLLRIVDFRGPDIFGVHKGQTLALLARPGAGDVVDPAPAILASSEIKNADSFVGIPLEMNDGSHFGTLCAISNAAKRFHRNEVELLTVLGRVIVNELDREIKEQEFEKKHADLAAHAERLRSDAFSDPLTGVANRRGFERALAREWKLSRRGTVESYLVLVDLDGFKDVNDRFGHAAGDRVLQLCAQALQEAARGTDVVGRIGGDEFAAILVGCESADDAIGYRERAHITLERYLKGEDARVSFSAGHQSLADTSSPSRAMELADQAMYWQKRQRAGRLPRGTDLASKMGRASRKSKPVVETNQ
ncbi:MAG: sensor domain-containing diguanylate cyclase [Solirubrobacterales bacterium]